MKQIDLSVYGISNPKNVFYNLSYDELFEHETSRHLVGLEKVYLTNTGAIAVDTGVFTGRSPKDKYFVKDHITADEIWWTTPGRKSSDNKPISEEIWQHLLKLCQQELSGKDVYVMDAFVGANPSSRLRIRVITEVAWAAHFVKNMFIRPSDEELKNFSPDFVLLHAPKAVNPDWHRQGLNSDIFIAFHLTRQMCLIGGTWYGGEIKKGMFTVMNYILPKKGILSMHCSANMGRNGDTALFFGLSGTGKTTLSTDPERFLIGDDEHGWDEEGIFNLEGGCYAKCINLDKEKEPDIYKAIKRNALLENVVIDPATGEIDFNNAQKTENTRVSYPIEHIDNIVKPVSKGGHPKYIIFLTADAFGIFPPVARLNHDQAMYYFLSGYTSKLAGTERGIKEPVPTFSSAFGAAFLPLHPTKYAELLSEKISRHHVQVYLVNTGWIGGPYGIGQRIDIKTTRAIITAILNGHLDNADYDELEEFGLMIPRNVPNVDPFILNPKNTWKYPEAYEKQAVELAEKFIENFIQFTDTDAGKRLMAAGPKNKMMKEFYNYFLKQMENNKKMYQEKMRKLEDQLFILQNSLHDYISYNSVNKQYKNFPLRRHLPVQAYLATDQEEKIQIACQHIEQLLNALEFELYAPLDYSCHFIETICISKIPLTLPAVEEKLITLHKLIQQNDISDTFLLSAWNALAGAVKQIPHMTLKLGPVIILHYLNNDRIPTIKSYYLSISQLIQIEQNPKILRKPELLISTLQDF